MENKLKGIKRPSLALIKLVEVIGILLNVPKSFTKSKYKAPIPSNFDSTLELLSEGFYPALTQLSKLISSEIPNDIGNELFSKTQEPGFDYETAVNDGGLASRELFNGVMLILTKLQSDRFRLPVEKTNVLVVVNGTRSSYVALDTATHVFKHGVITISALTMDNLQDEQQGSLMKVHLHQDLVRRCKMLYKLPDHCFQVDNASTQSQHEVLEHIAQSLAVNQCGILVLGLEQDALFGEGGDGGVPLWAVKDVTVPLILAKGRSRTRSFSVISSPRTILICVKGLESLSEIFLQALMFARPGDSLVLASVVESAEPVGDGQDSRFDMGRRLGWTDGVEAPAGPSYPGWNDASVDTLVLEVCVCVYVCVCCLFVCLCI